MKILLAVDGSSYTKRMLAYVAAHDEWLGGSHGYTVMHCVPGVPPRAAAVLPKETLETYYAEEAEKVFAPIRAFFAQQKAQAQFVGRHGHAGDVIAEAASQGGYDMVIMGSHGHGTLRNLVLGSVATKVLAQCETPVLLIR